MENNKYFTPDIEDLHIGYQCEIYAQCTSKMIRKVEWHSVKVSYSPEISKYVGILQCKKLIKTHHIRVPYLTKEQIEAEGWKEMNAPIMAIGYGFLYIPFLKNNCRLDYNYTTNILNIKKDDVTNLYYGECKDINTFRKIVKLLGI